MGLLPRVFAKPTVKVHSRTPRADVTDRLTFFVTSIAQQAEEPVREPFVVDKNYQVILPGR